MSKLFKFGPEHVGLPVRNEDGRKGFIRSVKKSNDPDCQLIIEWQRGRGVPYSLEGKFFDEPSERVVVFLDHSITVKDCDIAISYGPDGLTTFGITAEYQSKEQPATVALFDFLRWVLDQNFIGGYSAEEPGEEIVTLPVPPELEDNRLSLRVLHVCDWLRTLPLSVIETACNGNLSMWQLLDAETGENV